MHDADIPLADRRKSSDCDDHERRLIGIEHANASVKSALESLNTKVDLILAQVTKVAILEEKHTAQQIDLTRAHRKIETLEAEHAKEIESLCKKVDELAIESRSYISETRGMAKMAVFIWTTMGAAVFLLMIKVMFFTPASPLGLLGK